MFVSLNKNKWLQDWMQDKWHDEIIALHLEEAGDDFPFIPDIKSLNKRLANFLSSKGYRSKVSRNDIIIFMPDEEFIFAKIKYL